MPKHMFSTTLDWQSTDMFECMWARYNFRSKTSEYLSRTTMADGKPAYGMIDVGLKCQTNRSNSN